MEYIDVAAKEFSYLCDLDFHQASFLVNFIPQTANFIEHLVDCDFTVQVKLPADPLFFILGWRLSFARTLSDLFGFGGHLRAASCVSFESCELVV